MIDRVKVESFMNVLDQLSEEDADFRITSNGKFELTVYPKQWYSGGRWSEEKRHKMLALITPLIGKLEKFEDGGNIGYSGENETTRIRLSYIDVCKIVGYRTVTKTVKTEVEREPEFTEEEVSERVPITDCDIRSGKFSEEDIEIKA